jgi:hypothetical protein
MWFESVGRIQNGNWDTDADCMSSRNQRPCWDVGDMLGWGKEQGKAKTSEPCTPSLWKSSPHHNTLKEQANSHMGNRHQATTYPPAHQASARLQAHRHVSPPGFCLIGPPAHWPPSPGPPTNHLATAPPDHHLPPGTGVLQHHQKPAPNLPRRCRQTRLDAKGITPELVRLKFYCSWTGKFFFSFFFFFVFLLLSWFCYFYYCKLANTKLHIDQG